MKKLLWAFAAITLSGQAIMATCYKCEEIREKNKNLPPLKYEYYDDYLEALKAEGKPIPGNIDFEDDANDQSDSKDISMNQKK